MYIKFTYINSGKAQLCRCPHEYEIIFKQKKGKFRNEQKEQQAL
ncbi:hypothetical protein SAMN05443550_10628 [Pedobacter hartonius]|uniref:Uncharacterized protein n=1 Tax=Pedobacter hartonius TaxID=425514 RepID=A0A1H4EMZ0_9SPHI|nr:hypothetical protein SAMN05443550_10628 [Pedobacter hartonius]